MWRLMGATPQLPGLACGFEVAAVRRLGGVVGFGQIVRVGVKRLLVRRPSPDGCILQDSCSPCVHDEVVVSARGCLIFLPGRDGAPDPDRNVGSAKVDGEYAGGMAAPETQARPTTSTPTMETPARCTTRPRPSTPVTSWSQDRNRRHPTLRSRDRRTSRDLQHRQRLGRRLSDGNVRSRPLSGTHCLVRRCAASGARAGSSRPGGRGRRARPGGSRCS